MQPKRHMGKPQRKSGERPTEEAGKRKAHRAEASPRPPSKTDTTAAARDLLGWIMHPGSGATSVAERRVTRDVFIADTLEKDAKHTADRGAAYFAQPPADVAKLLPSGVAWSTERMRAAVATGKLNHGTDINVVRFDPKLQRRVPLKTEGKVLLAEYDQALASGWSVRFLRPQEHEAELSSLLFLFDEAMQCSTGMNSYWTPPGSQGFAPHYDDVEVFMLQLEGSKRWRVYAPPEPADVLCRTSSPDYKPADMGAPLMDVWLKAGEVLYLPRGFIHQGITSEDEHSLHVTLSAFQMHTYADLAKRMMDYKLELIAKTDVDARRALPVGWLDCVGGAFNKASMGPYSAVPGAAGASELGAEAGAALRKEVFAQVRRVVAKAAADVAAKDGIVDKGADLFATDVLARRQPPAATVAAAAASDLPAAALDSATAQLRLVARNACRVVVMADEVELHHCGGNSKVCLGDPTLPPKISFDIAFAPALVALISAYPKWRKVSELPFPELEDEDVTALQDAQQSLLDALVSTRVFDARPCQ